MRDMHAVMSRGIDRAHEAPSRSTPLWSGLCSIPAKEGCAAARRRVRVLQACVHAAMTGALDPVLTRRHDRLGGWNRAPT